MRWNWLFALVLLGCHSAPIRVAPLPDVAAVRQQNQTTRKHIASARQHIDKSQQGEAMTGTSLEDVKKDLDLLLRWMWMTP